MTRTFVIGLLLAVVTLAVYAQVRDHDFVTLDDPHYVTDNPRITRGLTWEGVRWAFGHVHAGNWHPVTSMSHMIDCGLFGAWAGGHHLTSAAIHALNGVLLFLAFRLMTGDAWRSLLVAALFALHPLRVESVAWVSERKDVLAGLFWMLTLIAYARYVKRPGWIRYLSVACFLALGLMSKPMVVTLPFVLLLLDVWPLRRLTDGSGLSWSRLTVEKVPLLAMSAAAAVVTVLVQKSEGALRSIDDLPLTVRLANGLASYVDYLRKTLWPTNLAVFYPHPAYVREDATSTTIVTAAVAATVLAAVTVVALRFRRSRPYLAVGWLWYIGTLVPVIGLLQVGDQAMADRYTYLPQIGILFAAVWGVSEIAQRRRATRLGFGLAAVSAVAALTVVTWIQIGPWRTSDTLYAQTLRATSDNYRVHALLGQVYLERGDLEGAETQFQRVLGIKPDKADAHVSLGEVARRRGDLPTAELHLRHALEIAPDHAEAHNNLGVLYARAARYDEAAEQLESALAIEPASLEAHVNFGLVLLNQRRPDDAARSLVRAIDLRPDSAAAHGYLGVAYSMSGEVGRAETHLRRALELQPDDPRWHASLGNLLSSQDRLPEAADLYRKALQLDPRFIEASPYAAMTSTK